MYVYMDTKLSRKAVKVCRGGSTSGKSNLIDANLDQLFPKSYRLELDTSSRLGNKNGNKILTFIWCATMGTQTWYYIDTLICVLL